MPSPYDASGLSGATCIITGANSGIGKAAATELARMGGRVVMVCRSRDRGRKALVEICQASGSSTVDLVLADLTQLSEVRRLAAELAGHYPQIDLLINNAGGFRRKREVTTEGLESTFVLNHLAPLLLTLLLEPTLRASAPARVINVNSDAHRRGRISFDNLQGERLYRGFKAYANAKLANLMATYRLADRFSGSGVSINALHPGVVATRFAQGGGGIVQFFFSAARPLLRSPEEGAKTITYLASDPAADGISGGYFVDEKARKSSRRSYDTDVSSRLWSRSLDLIGLGKG